MNKTASFPDNTPLPREHMQALNKSHGQSQWVQSEAPLWEVEALPDDDRHIFLELLMKQIGKWTGMKPSELDATELSLLVNMDLHGMNKLYLQYITTKQHIKAQNAQRLMSAMVDTFRELEASGWGFGEPIEEAPEYSEHEETPQAAYQQELPFEDEEIVASTKVEQLLRAATLADREGLFKEADIILLAANRLI